ncbi:hypothetical protein [Spiroplasma endosymbiont of Tricholauxania praeusta]|uniref:hypothetical protein n=1 Tax=Spiroplasma endosymbiont of Tricholauxania praeusta TaxID=3066296 RepID=UPI0030CA9302
MDKEIFWVQIICLESLLIQFNTTDCNHSFSNPNNCFEIVISVVNSLRNTCVAAT